MTDDEKITWRAHYFRVLKIISEYKYEGKKAAIGWPALDRKFYSAEIVEQEGYGRLNDLIRDVEQLEEIQRGEKGGLLLPEMSDEELTKLADKLMLRRFFKQ